MRVLLVEDSRRLRESVGRALRRSGYAVDMAEDGDEGAWLAETHDYDAIVLDIMLPKLDGLSVLDRLRRGKRSTHVLLLTARDRVEDRVRGLKAGADDYLVKPFALEELIARVEALCRRAYQDKQTELCVGGMKLDTVARKAWCNGTEIDLTAREYQLLEYLMRRQGEVVSRTEIEAHIYDEMVNPMSNVVDSAICALRRKLGSSGRQAFIQTRRGHGYVFDAE